MKSLDLTELLESVSEFLEGELGRAGIRLDFKDPGPQIVMGDQDLLFQVFTNLIMNAVQAMENHDGPRNLTLSATTGPGGAGFPGKWVTALVEDTGPGIEAEALTQVFEPFFTTKSGAAGTGLGLAVARSAVEEMGGSISVEVRGEVGTGKSGEGRGTGGARFSVRLPAAEKEEAEDG